MDDWTYETAPDLDKTVEERLRGFPRQPDMSVYLLRSAAALLLRGWLRTYHRLEIRGRENLPDQESFVMVANHGSHLDALCLLASLPLGSLHRAFPAAAADYFFSSFPRGAFSAIFINALPFDRKAKGAESLAVCSELLKNPGNILIIFPEGTRTTTGEVGRFRSGVGRLVAGRDIPVLPCFLDNAWRAWPKGKKFPRPRKLELTICKPRTFSSRATTRDSVHQIVAELQEAVMECAPGPSPGDSGPAESGPGDSGPDDSLPAEDGRWPASTT